MPEHKVRYSWLRKAQDSTFAKLENLKSISRELQPPRDADAEKGLAVRMPQMRTKVSAIS